MFEGRINVPAGTGTVIGTVLGNLAACGLDVLGLLTGILLDLQCREVDLNIPITFFGDAPVVDAKHPDIGWFARNEWYRVLYYATARTVSPARGTSIPDCSTGDSCLELRRLPAAAEHDKRALLFLAGRSLNATIGHNRALTDFLDIDPNRDTGQRFEAWAFGANYNDRVWVVQNDYVNPTAQRGFTLVEVAIAVAIVSLMMVGRDLHASTSVDQRAYEETRNRLNHARELLLAYAVVNGRMPCPARSTSAGWRCATRAGSARTRAARSSKTTTAAISRAAAPADSCPRPRSASVIWTRTASRSTAGTTRSVMRWRRR